MGCDIHIFIEKKNDDGVWVNDDDALPHIYHGRDYFLFSILAGGVRNGSSFCIGLPRGLPKNSPNREYLNACMHYHTHSYLMRDELLNFSWGMYVSRRYDEWIQLRDEVGGEFFRMLDYMKNLDCKDCRIVFAFDS